VFVKIDYCFNCFKTGSVQKSPDEIKAEFTKLIEESSSVSPKLSQRLSEMNRWIADKKPGLLMSKPYVMQLLRELIADAAFLLAIESLPLEDREPLFADLSQTEKYWYKILFPAWINEQDPKKDAWKKKLMAGEFNKSDERLIDKVCQEIKNLGGDTVNPYIADLSMATDLIASGIERLPLCVQLTSVQDSYSQTKQVNWLSTLEYWKIKRGLFIDFNPRLSQVEFKIAQKVFQDSDRIKENCYPKIRVDR
jgi:hypothetical protein